MDNRKFAKIAKKIASDWYNQPERVKATKTLIDESNVFIVWIAKVLQSNKAMLAADTFDGLYFEVTYNGDKREWYVDVYSKTMNKCLEIKEDDEK